MILYPVIYPPSLPPLSSTYPLPERSVLVYSRTDPDDAEFYLPSRLVPGKPSGASCKFIAHHQAGSGLYPACKLASSIYVTTDLSYSYLDVKESLIAFKVSAFTLDVGFIDPISKQLSILTNLSLSLSTHPETINNTGEVTIPRAVTERLTAAPNNLPIGINSLDLSCLNGLLQLAYFPPRDCLYSYLNIRLYNPNAVPIQALLKQVTDGQAFSFTYRLKPLELLVLDNQIMLHTEELYIGAIEILPLQVYVGASHMGGDGKWK